MWAYYGFVPKRPKDWNPIYCLQKTYLLVALEQAHNLANLSLDSGLLKF